MRTKYTVNRRKYLDEIAIALHIKTQKDWTRVTYSNFVRRVKIRLLTKYGDSVDKMLASVYPEFLWYSIDRNNVSHRYWDSLENRRNFLVKTAKVIRPFNPHFSCHSPYPQNPNLQLTVEEVSKVPRGMKKPPTR